VEHREFLLFPTFLHQNLNMLKPTVQGDYTPHDEEPARSCDLLRWRRRRHHPAQVARADEQDDDEHIWTAPLLDMRFNYRRTTRCISADSRLRLPRARTRLPLTPAYAGCKSWVPLELPIEIGDALPVMDDVTFEMRRKRSSIGSVRKSRARSTHSSGTPRCYV
jgi:hypothetical protein